MRHVRARYENGALLPAKPLPLAPGESVSILVVKDSQPSRWDLTKLAAVPQEDLGLAATGLDDWAAALDKEDRG